MLKLPLLLTLFSVSIILQNCGSTNTTNSNSSNTTSSNTTSNSIQSKELKPTLFVDRSYSGGSSDGSIKRPFTKINEALIPAGANAVIEVAQGTYEEPLSITKDVSIIGKVTRNEKNEIIKRPVIVSPQERIISITGKNLTFDGFEIVGSTNFDKYDNSGNLISLGEYNQSCDADIHAIYIGQSASDVRISQNYIHQIGHDYIFCVKKSYDCVKNNPCLYAHGINANNYSSEKIRGVKILDNVLSNLHLAQSEAITLNGNVHDFTISGNTVYNVDNIAIDIGGFQETCPETENPDDCRAIKGSITGNTISRLIGTKDPKNELFFNPGQRSNFPWIAGIYIDGGTGESFENEKNILIEKNTVSDFGIGVSIGAENPKKHDKVTVKYISVKDNVVFNNLVTGILVGKDNDAQKSNLDNCQVVNNTFYGNSRDYKDKGWTPGTIRFGNMFKGSLQNILVKDNLIVAVENEFLTRVEGKDSKNFVTFDGNVFYSITSEGRWNWDNHDETSFDAFEKRVIKGNDEFIDPIFVSTTPNKRSGFQLSDKSTIKGKNKGALTF